MVTNSQWHCVTLSFTFLPVAPPFPSTTLLPYLPLFITRFKPRSHPFLLHSLYTHRVNIIYSSGVFRDRPISRQRKLGKEVFPLLKHLFLKLAIKV